MVLIVCLLVGPRSTEALRANKSLKKAVSGLLTGLIAFPALASEIPIRTADPQVIASNSVRPVNPGNQGRGLLAVSATSADTLLIRGKKEIAWYNVFRRLDVLEDTVFTKEDAKEMEARVREDMDARDARTRKEMDARDARTRKEMDARDERTRRYMAINNGVTFSFMAVSLFFTSRAKDSQV